MKIISYVLISAGIWWILLWLVLFGVLYDKQDTVIEVGENRATFGEGTATAIILGIMYIVAGFIIDRKKFSVEYKKIAGVRRFNFTLIVIGTIWLVVFGAAYANPAVWESYKRDNVSITSIIAPIASVSGFGVLLIIAAVQQHAKDRKTDSDRLKNIGSK
jgi:hypothetical protein